jgi:hypothetical protein
MFADYDYDLAVRLVLERLREAPELTEVTDPPSGDQESSPALA